MRVVSVHQPNFMPWVKLLDKVLGSDVYVAYDTVQYTKSEYHSRQKIKTHYGDAWLTVPLLSQKGRLQRIDEVRIDNKQPWRRKHLHLLRVNYAKAPFFEEVYELVRAAYAKEHEELADLGTDLIVSLCGYLGSEVEIVRASALPHSGDNTQRLVDLVRAVGGDTHLTSTFGTDRRYIDWERLLQVGIGLQVQRVNHPVYPYLHGPFVANLSALDMLFNCGRQTAAILAADRDPETIDRQALAS